MERRVIRLGGECENASGEPRDRTRIRGTKKERGVKTIVWDRVQFTDGTGNASGGVTRDKKTYNGSNLVKKKKGCREESTDCNVLTGGAREFRWKNKAGDPDLSGGVEGFWEPA